MLRVGLTVSDLLLFNFNLFYMTVKKSELTQSKKNALSFKVTNDLTVQLFTNPQFSFLMDTKTVAKGYGVSPATIRSHKAQNKDEFSEKKHFVSNVQILNGAINNTRTTMWTKAGVIRLGFFIKSQRAKLFRDWAENVILEVTAPPATLPPVQKRNHNRLTQGRLVDILADVARIDDKELRLSLLSKLIPTA